jgi:hypothetical protein
MCPERGLPSGRESAGRMPPAPCIPVPEWSAGPKSDADGEACVCGRPAACALAKPVRAHFDGTRLREVPTIRSAKPGETVGGGRPGAPPCPVQIPGLSARITAVVDDEWMSRAPSNGMASCELPFAENRRRASSARARGRERDGQQDGACGKTRTRSPHDLIIGLQGKSRPACASVRECPPSAASLGDPISNSAAR